MKNIFQLNCSSLLRFLCLCASLVCLCVYGDCGLGFFSMFHTEYLFLSKKKSKNKKQINSLVEANKCCLFIYSVGGNC